MLELIWKVLENVMDLRLEAILLQDSLHGCLALGGTGSGIIEAELVQQIVHLEQTPFFGIFIDLRKAFYTMDWDCCLVILALHGAGPQMLCLICNFWDMATNVCWAKGDYGRPFKAGCGMTQGGPLSAKLLNIIVNVVVCEWMRLMRKTINNAEGDLAKRIEGLFAVFYVDDGYIASHDAEFLQGSYRRPLTSLPRRSSVAALPQTQRRPRQRSACRAGYGCDSQQTHTSVCARGLQQGKS